MQHFLQENHRQDLEASGLTQDTIARRGYISAVSEAQAAEYSDSDALPFRLTQNQHMAGLIIPVFMDGGRVYAQVKPFCNALTDASGKAIKYLSPAGMAFDGNGQVYDFGPGELPDPSRNDAKIFLTEGVKKGDALRQCYPDDLVIALQSPTALLGKKNGLIRSGIWAQISKYAEHEVKIYLCFDSDMATNPDVWAAVDRCRARLSEHFADSVRIVCIPPDGDAKAGIDDFYAARGAVQVNALILLASENVAMPPTPKRDGRRRPKPTEQRDAETWLGDYKAYLEEQRATFGDSTLEATWEEEQGDGILFDTITGMPYLLSEGDRIYRACRADTPAGEIARWIRNKIATGAILTPPNRAICEQGDYGIKAYRDAQRARNVLTDKLTAQTKAKNVATLLATNPNLNTEHFCDSAYDHLFPLTGGMSIDFSQAPGADSALPFACPLVQTPPDARFTWCSPVTADAYRVAAGREYGVSEVLDDFLASISDGDNEKAIALLGFMGYALHGFRKQRFFVLHGDGRNGKGVYLRMLAYLLGDGAYNASPKTFAGEDKRHDAHWLEHRNRRLVACADPAGYLADSRLLPYSGGDAMPAEVKGGALLTFTPTACLFFHGQADRIKFRVADNALKDRMCAIELTRRFTPEEQDNELDSRLRDDAALILCRISHEANLYHNAVKGHGDSEDFTGEQTWRDGRNALIAAANSVASFVENTQVYVVLDADGESDVTIPNFVAHYNRWCQQYGETPITNAGGAMIKALQAAYPHVALRRARDELQEGTRFHYLDGIYFARHTQDSDKNPNGEIQDRLSFS